MVGVSVCRRTRLDDAEREVAVDPDLGHDRDLDPVEAVNRGVEVNLDPGPDQSPGRDRSPRKLTTRITRTRVDRDPGLALGASLRSLKRSSVDPDPDREALGPETNLRPDPDLGTIGRPDPEAGHTLDLEPAPDPLKRTKGPQRMVSMIRATSICRLDQLYSRT